MTAVVRVLTVGDVDTSPSLLLIAPDGTKILVDCGDGCQRVCLEQGEKMSSIRAVCFTSLNGATTIGGFPGFLLTAADSQHASYQHIHSAKSSASALSAPVEDDATRISTIDATMVSEEVPATIDLGVTPLNPALDAPLDLPGMDVIGPRGTRAFIHSLRHFMRREKYPIRVHEAESRTKTNMDVSDGIATLGVKKFLRTNRRSPPDATRKRKQPGLNVSPLSPCPEQLEQGNAEEAERVSRIDELYEPGFYTVYPLHLSSVNRDLDSNNAKYERELVSYLFITPPVPGKFRPEKAREIGVPKGPLYAKLKAGQSVSFQCSVTGRDRTVQSSEVVDASTPGNAVLVWSHRNGWMDPSNGDKGGELNPLVSLKYVEDICRQASNNLDLVVHWGSTQGAIGQCIRILHQEFPGLKHHLVVDSNGNKSSFTTPFRSALVGAYARSMLSPVLFPEPWIENGVGYSLEASNAQAWSEIEGLVISNGCPGTEYFLLPRVKAGFVSEARMSQSKPTIQEEASVLAAERGALSEASRIASRRDFPATAVVDDSNVLFAGTGSSIPCKHRNVTGMRLSVLRGNQADSSIYKADSTGKGAILLDVGEGTVGQLYRADACRTAEHRRRTMLDIKAAWVSHPHADHHLGLLRLLTERAQFQDLCANPLIIIGPHSLFCFLDEYVREVDPTIANSFAAFDCKDLVCKRGGSVPVDTVQNEFARDSCRARLTQQLLEQVGISGGCVAVPVTHCPQAYAMIIDGVPGFGRVVWSGDCRPSSVLARAAFGADLLIHEATFEDGMEVEANFKRHSTVSEALGVAREMDAKAVVLTHFSQRYPKVPPLPDLNDLTTEGTVSNRLSDGAQRPVIVAFDFMKLSASTLQIASQLIPALRLLYAADENERRSNGAVRSEVDAIMSTPGIFAQSHLL
jgi:ribonuclease Z